MTVRRPAWWLVALLVVVALLLVWAVILGGAGALQAAPGDMLWPEQTFNLTGCDVIEVRGLAASSTTLIVCGTAYDSTIDTGDLGFIKAFDLATGEPKWEKLLTTGVNRNSFDSLAVVGTLVVATGYSCSYIFPTILIP